MTTNVQAPPSVADILAQAAKALFPNEGKASIDVRTKSADGDTALHVAALWGDEAAVDQLIKAGAFVDEPGGGGRTALYYAALKGHVSVAERLIAASADPDHVGDLGMSPRGIAQQIGDERMIKLFES
jgi:ankyrin repeat protein